MKKAVVFILLLLLSSLQATKTNNVGVAKRLRVSLPGELLMAARFDDKSRAMVRVISAQQTAQGFTYELEFIGLEPGKYDLMKYLRYAKTSEPVNLPDYPIEVETSLEPQFSGELVDFQKTVPTLTPWYKKLNKGLAITWLLLLPVIIFYGRKKKKPTGVATVKEETLNAKIRALVSRVEVNSTKELWQKIESLLLQHWCQKKGLENLPMHEAMTKLKADKEAGPFIVELEKGLHAKKYGDKQEMAEMIKGVTSEEVLT